VDGSGDGSLVWPRSGAGFGRRHHERVRSFVLILIIALLPIRMWAAEAMSIRMAGQEGPSTASMGMDSMQAMDDMPPDCPMLAAAEKAQKDESKGSGTACLSCQLCAAVDVSADFKPLAEASPALPAILASSNFDSADPTRENKPPIS
jgi:hypothetical protein